MILFLLVFHDHNAYTVAKVPLFKVNTIIKRVYNVFNVSQFNQKNPILPSWAWKYTTLPSSLTMYVSLPSSLTMYVSQRQTVSPVAPLVL